MNITPLYDKVVLKPADVVEKTAGGIILPEDSRRKKNEAVVIAVGTGIVTQDGNVVPLQCLPGDRVVYDLGSAREIKIAGEDVLVVKETDIIAIIR